MILWAETNSLFSCATIQTTISDSNSEVVDQIESSEFRTVKYLIQVSSVSNGFQSTELLLNHNSTVINTMEYGSISTASKLVVPSAYFVNSLIFLKLARTSSELVLDVIINRLAIRRSNISPATKLVN
jgi:hypothetical protein